MKKLTRDLVIFSSLLLVCALFAHAQGVFVPQQTALKNVNGLTTPIAGATITVCAASASGIPCSPVLTNTIFSNAALSQALANPFTADSQGNYQFAVAPGTYTVTVTSLGFSGNSYQVTAGSGGAGGGGGGSTTWPTITGGVSNGQTFTLGSSNFNLGGTGVVDLSGGNPLSAFKLPIGAGASPTATGVFAYDSSANDAVFGNGTLRIKVKDWGSIYGPGPNTAALTVGTLGSLLPTGFGQISSISDWFGTGPAAQVPGTPTLTASLTGGTLNTGSSMYVRLTFVGQSVIVPSVEVVIQLNATTGCGSGAICSVTVTMPPSCTSPAAPATGCTVWSGITAVDAERQQAASAACVNITAATCVIGTAGAGALLSSVVAATSGTNPTPFNASSMPDFIIPSVFIQKANGYYGVAGVDESALNYISCCFTNPPLTAPTKAGTNGGTFTWTDRFFFNDDVNPPPISNALVSIKHESGATTSTKTTAGAGGPDDRALTVRIDNDLTSNPNYDQYLAQYNEAFVDNNATTCAPIGSGTPYGESCVAAGRFITTDLRTAPSTTLGAPMVGVAGVTSSGVSGATGFSSCTYCFVGGVFGAFESVNSTNLGGSTMVGVLAGVNGSSPNSNGGGRDYVAAAPGIRFASSNYGMLIEDFGSNNADFNFFSNASNLGTGKNYFAGPAWFAQPVLGSILPTKITTPTAQYSVGVTCATTCTATYTYVVVAKDIGGGWAAASTSVGTGAVAATTLNGSNFNTISILALPPTMITGTSGGVAAWDVYRTAVVGGNPSTTGYLGSMNCYINSLTCNFIDNGVAISTPTNSDSPTPPTYNTSGSVAGFTYRTTTNCKVNSASPAACGAAPAGSFVIPTTTTTYTVNTSVVSMNSEIFIQATTDNTGMAGAPTCVAPAITTLPILTGRTAGTSFTMGLASTAGSTCWHYWLVN